MAGFDCPRVAGFGVPGDNTLWSVAYSLDAVINYRIFDSVPKTNPLPLAGVFWAGGILVLHVWLFVEILLAAKTGNFSLVRGLRQFRL